MRKIVYLLFFAAVAITSACKKEDADPGLTGVWSFVANIGGPQKEYAIFQVPQKLSFNDGKYTRLANDKITASGNFSVTNTKQVIDGVRMQYEIIFNNSAGTIHTAYFTIKGNELKIYRDENSATNSINLYGR